MGFWIKNDIKCLEKANNEKLIKFHWKLKKHFWFFNFLSVWTYEDKYDFDDFKQYLVIQYV